MSTTGRFIAGAIVLAGCELVAAADTSAPPLASQPAAPATTPATLPSMTDRLLDKSESAGHTVGEGVARASSAAAESAGTVLQKTGAKTGAAVGAGVSTLVQGAVRGIDSSIPDAAQGMKLNLSEELKNLGVVVNRSECRLGHFQLYLINRDPFHGALTLKVFDAQGKETARAKREVTFSDDDGQQVELDFPFGTTLPKGGRLELTLRPIQPPTTAPAPSPRR